MGLSPGYLTRPLTQVVLTCYYKQNRLTVATVGDSITTASPRDNAMKSSRSKSRKRKSIISSLRRPLAPPGHPLTEAKPAAKARPAGRKAKHKQRPEKLELEDEY